MFVISFRENVKMCMREIFYMWDATLTVHKILKIQSSIKVLLVGNRELNVGDIITGWKTNIVCKRGVY